MKELEDLYRSDYKRFVNTIKRRVGNNLEAAEDIVQESFSRAFKFYDSFNPEVGKLKTWFNRILFNVLRDEQVRHKKDLTLGLLNVGSSFDVESGELPPDVKHTIYNAINQVKNKRHKRIIELYFIYGYTSKEISNLERVSVSNVTTVVMRFKEKM